MKSNPLKSVWAVVAGFLVIVVLSAGFDTVLKIMDILPWGHLFVSTGLILFVIFCRTVFSLAGCYLTAKLAPQNPMKYAIILGIIGAVLSAIGAIVAAHLGPTWYAWTLAAIALPIAWLAGKLHEKQAGHSKQNYIIKQ